MKKILLLTSLIGLATAQSAVAANYTIQNNTADFWNTSKSWTNADIWWNVATVPTFNSTADQIIGSSRFADSTVDVTTAVDVKVLKLGHVKDVAGDYTLTLNVGNAASFNTNNITEVGRNAKAILNIDGGTYTSVSNATFGEYNGIMNITSGGAFTAGAGFVVRGSGAINVVDGTLNLTQADIVDTSVSILMDLGGTLDLQGSSTVVLAGDQTISGNFNTYIDSGWITSNGNTGAANFSQVFDGTNTIVSVAAVPEPATYALLGGLVALGSVMMRRRK
jgi:hypothetical protein